MSDKDLSIISCRLDPDLKMSWFSLCDQLGLTPSCCINLLVKQMVRDRSLPFVPTLQSKKEKGSDQ